MFFDIRQNEESARDYTTTILKRKNEGISKMADNRVIIFDTTLRDGEQSLHASETADRARARRARRGRH